MLAASMSLYWWINELTKNEAKTGKKPENMPDAYAHGLTVTRYDENGHLFQVLPWD
jgi:lipopolysaccharide export system protein LptC